MCWGETEEPSWDQGNSWEEGAYSLESADTDGHQCGHDHDWEAPWQEKGYRVMSSLAASTRSSSQNEQWTLVKPKRAEVSGERLAAPPLKKAGVAETPKRVSGIEARNVNSFQMLLDDRGEDENEETSREEQCLEAKRGLQSIRVQWQSEVEAEKKRKKEEKKKRKKGRQGLSFLGERPQNGISNLNNSGYRQVEVTVDSGACDTVIPTDECRDIATVESEQSRKGFEYEVANGETITNLGEKR